MSHFFLEFDQNTKVEELVQVCKSTSNIKGKELRDAHYQLGTIIAPHIVQNMNTNSLTVIILLRAGLCFAQGIADEIETLGKNVTFLFQSNDENCFTSENAEFITNAEILLVDAVINSGKSIDELLKQLSEADQIMLSTTVIQEETIDKFKEHDLFAVRASKNKYTGERTNIIHNGKGPDTGDRLFNTM